MNDKVLKEACLILNGLVLSKINVSKFTYHTVYGSWFNRRSIMRKGKSVTWIIVELVTECITKQLFHIYHSSFTYYYL